MFDSTDTLSAVSADGSVREAAVEAPAATFYIGDTPITRGKDYDETYPNYIKKHKCSIVIVRFLVRQFKQNETVNAKLCRLDL